MKVICSLKYFNWSVRLKKCKINAIWSQSYIVALSKDTKGKSEPEL